MAHAKSIATQLSPNFTSTEFNCKCRNKSCTTTEINPALAEILKNARERGETLKQQQSANPVQPAAKPNPYANNMMALLSGNANGIVVKSSTEGSEKHFRITVDDSGVISAAEVTVE